MAKPAILACHQAAREAEANPVAQAAARAIGQAASTIHSASHALGLALYGGLALAYDELEIDASWSVTEAYALACCEEMLNKLKTIAIEDEPNPVKVKWYC